MTAAETLILNFSGIYTDGGFVENLREKGEGFRLVDLSDLDGTSCYLDPESEKEIIARSIPVREPVRWIDSGDYHYVSKLYSDLVKMPFTLVLFDNHPDDQAPSFGGVLSCGSWVREVSANPLLRRIVAVGPDGRADALDFEADENVYVSVDLDVLSDRYIRTDWSQGNMTPESLEQCLSKVFSSQANVLSVDICGGLSDFKGARSSDRSLNLDTWLRLFDYLKQNFKQNTICSL